MKEEDNTENSRSMTEETYKDLKKGQSIVINGVRIEGIGHDLIRATAPLGYHWESRYETAFGNDGQRTDCHINYGNVLYEDVFTSINARYILTKDKDSEDNSLPEHIDCGLY